MARPIAELRLWLRDHRASIDLDPFLETVPITPVVRFRNPADRWEVQEVGHELADLHRQRNGGSPACFYARYAMGEGILCFGTIPDRIADDPEEEDLEWADDLTLVPVRVLRDRHPAPQPDGPPRRGRPPRRRSHPWWKV